MLAKADSLGGQLWPMLILRSRAQSNPPVLLARVQQGSVYTQICTDVSFLAVLVLPWVWSYLGFREKAQLAVTFAPFPEPLPPSPSLRAVPLSLTFCVGAPPTMTDNSDPAQKTRVVPSPSSTWVPLRNPFRPRVSCPADHRCLGPARARPSLP